MDDKVLEQIQQIKKRIDKLESVVFSNRYQEKATILSETKKYAGPKGGILLLRQEGFLKTKRTTDEIRIALEKKEYIYKREVVQTALNRLSKSTGPLVKMEEEGKKVYVERK